jgi:hypothetical protein
VASATRQRQAGPAPVPYLTDHLCLRTWRPAQFVRFLLQPVGQLTADSNVLQTKDTRP